MSGKRGVQSLEKIKEILSKHKEEIKQIYKVKEIGIFGSFVRGEQKRGSDVYVLVEHYELPGLQKFISLEMYIEKLLRKKVDLVEKESIRAELKKRILDEAIYI